MVGIGLLGTGQIARRYMQGLSEVQSHEVKVVFSKDCNKAKIFASEWDIPAWTNNMESVYSDKSINLIIIALPNYVHKDAVLLASEMKKNVICTKPLALNAKEAKIMLEAVNKAGVLHGFIENHVFCPIHMRVKDMIINGGIGDILKINTIITLDLEFGERKSWFKDPKLGGGGVLIDLACHCIEDARYFFGKEIKPIEVFAWGGNLLYDMDVEDNAILILKFENGRIATSEVSWTVKGGIDIRNEIYGSEGTLFTDSTKSSGIRAYSNKGIGYVVEKSGINTGWTFPAGSAIDEARSFGFHEAMKHFIECVKDNKMPRENFEDGYIVNIIMDAAYKSMKTCRWEKIVIK